MSEIPQSRWQANITSLDEGIRKIYENKEFHDVEFKLKGKHLLCAHSLVLASRSLKFAGMFLNNLGHKEINITDKCITETGFKNLICFIYTSTINTEDKKEIIVTYMAAKHYEQKALMLECERKIDQWTITTADVWMLLDAGLDLPKLKNNCIAFIKNAPNFALTNEANKTSPSFLKISFQCLITILIEDVLNEVPAMERINKIMEWVAECPDYKTDKGVDYSCVRKVFLANHLLKHLGFHTMNALELQKPILKYKGLLTADEVMQFMLFFESKNEEHLPEWCKLSNPAV